MGVLKIPIIDYDNPNLLFFLPETTIANESWLLGYITMFDVETPFDF